MDSDKFIHVASQKGDCATVKRLLDEKADVNERGLMGWTPLICAANKGHTTCVKLLIERKANVHALTTTGNTSLHLAAGKEGTVLCLDILIMAGLNVNTRSYLKTTPLGYAYVNRHYENIERLLDWGCKDVKIGFFGEQIDDPRFLGLVSRRRLVKDTILLVQTLLRKRLGVCKDMANEIGKKIWETRRDEKWALEGGSVKRLKK